eukprot:TRINITY_DN7773_c0_g1_i2.p1 TRINITY_DN7773_c0_g1~~TRINITY_DN7773_c0_g1_i2.p1  ORF type:complete len:300 (-),score=53.42 TRINITY_DN7773_c0_g1_i2:4-843(-)
MCIRDRVRTYGELCELIRKELNVDLTLRASRYLLVMDQAGNFISQEIFLNLKENGIIFVFEMSPWLLLDVNDKLIDRVLSKLQSGASSDVPSNSKRNREELQLLKYHQRELERLNGLLEHFEQARPCYIRYLLKSTIDNVLDHLNLLLKDLTSRQENLAAFKTSEFYEQKITFLSAFYDIDESKLRNDINRMNELITKANELQSFYIQKKERFGSSIPNPINSSLLKERVFASLSHSFEDLFDIQKPKEEGEVLLRKVEEEKDKIECIRLQLELSLIHI